MRESNAIMKECQNVRELNKLIIKQSKQSVECKGTLSQGNLQEVDQKDKMENRRKEI